MPPTFAVQLLKKKSSIRKKNRAENSDQVPPKSVTFSPYKLPESSAPNKPHQPPQVPHLQLGMMPELPSIIEEDPTPDPKKRDSQEMVQRF